MNCKICKDKGYVTLSGANYKRIPCRCGQKAGGAAIRGQGADKI